LAVPVSLGALLALQEIESGLLLETGVAADRELLAAVLSVAVTPNSATNAISAAGLQFFTHPKIR
jgi:hypothetical protein